MQIQIRVTDVLTANAAEVYYQKQALIAEVLNKCQSNFSLSIILKQLSTYYRLRS